MLRFISILLVFLCFSNTSLSQNSINENSINSIIDNEYFNNYSLENFYLHTNKSIYFSQEEIFFKAYVVHEEDNKPFIETTNLHVSLYDFNNKLVLSELFYVNKGTSYGSIAIPEDIKTGNYTIQLNTQWNKNFKEGSLFPIKIYNINNTNTSLESAKNEELNITKKAQVAESFQDNNSGYRLINSKSKNSDIVRFQLKSNNETIAAEKDKFIYAISHKKGTTKSVAPIKLLNNINTYNLNFYKDSLFKGANSITVFNKQNEILAESNYFNKPKKEIDISTSIIKETNDSISLDIKLLNIAQETNISISVLYEQTKALDTNTTITKRFLESPENTDGFNAFPYKNRAPVLENENGLKLSGSVNTKIHNTSNYKVIFTSQANNLLLTTPISSDKKFEFKNLLLKHPSDYKLALVNKNQEVIKGDFFIYKNFVNFKADSILNNNLVNNLEKMPILFEEKEKEKATNKTTNYFPVNKEVEQLEEVFLKSVINKKEERILQINDENPFLGISTSFSKDYLVDLDKDYFLTLRQYLQRIPSIQVIESNFERLIVYTRRISTITGGDDRVLFILDGTPLDASSGLDIGHLNVTDFELISVNVSGSGYGIQGSNGVINLISRNHVESNNNTNTLVKEYQTSLGFNLDKSSLENSKLVFSNLQSSYYYKTIDWVPNFTLIPNSSNILKIKKPKSENVKLIINGFNNDGDLIYKVIELVKN